MNKNKKQLSLGTHLLAFGLLFAFGFNTALRLFQMVLNFVNKTDSNVSIYVVIAFVIMFCLSIYGLIKIGKWLWVNDLRSYSKTVEESQPIMFASLEDAQQNGWLFSDSIGSLDNQFIFSEMKKDSDVYLYQGLKKSSENLNDDQILVGSFLYQKKLIAHEPFSSDIKENFLDKSKTEKILREKKGIAKESPVKTEN